MRIIIVPIILLLFIRKNESKININIKIASCKENLNISYSGADEELLSENDRALFNITHEKLKQGIRKELGRYPVDVFVRDPTPYNNLYEKYNWKQVTRNVRVKNVIVYDIINENVEVKRINHINNTSRTINADVSVFVKNEVIVSTEWSQKGYSGVFLFNLCINSDLQKHKMNTKWKKNETISTSLKFGASKNGYVIIKPSETVIKLLMAKNTIILLKIDYATSLTGSVIANYEPVYGKYHFWAMSVAKIMKINKIKNEIVTSELIEIKCLTDPNIQVLDKVTKNKIRIITPLMRVNKRKKYNLILKNKGTNN
ncbi:uncharacterized protein LOC126979435 [Leptidea sinapis]|uniref:uncharacterized protein LOC126979435 n=1 Tax=Leptidea sinapis TaxID=189913 RepID=UPI00213DC268|nr:uncharacterized protein LOC126979435 [Leptidea sinapis]